MGAPINRTAKTAMDLNLVNGVTSDAPKLKASDDVLYDYVDGLNSAQDAHAQNDTLAHPDGSVKTAKIADGAVTTAKLADLAVTQAKIASGAVGPNQLQTGLAATADVQAQFTKRGLDVTSDPYNADPTGITDSTTAIQTAITDAATYSRSVYIPGGVYKITAAINLPSNAHIVGDGWSQSILKLTNVNACLNLPSSTLRQVIDNLQITTDGTLVNQAIKINDNCINYKINHVRIVYPLVKSFVTGISIGNSCYTGMLENIDIQRCGTGVTIGDVANYIALRKCSITYNEIGVLMTGGGRGRVIDSCDIELNSSDGIRTTNNGDLQIVNTYFDANAGYDVWCAAGTNSLDNLYMAGNQFYRNVSGTYIRLNMAQDSRATSISNNFVGGGVGQTYIAIDSQGFSNMYSIQDHFQGVPTPSPSTTLSIIQKGVIYPVKNATTSVFQPTSFTLPTTNTASMYRLDATSGNLVITLPDLVPSGGAPYNGFSIELVRWDNSANNVTFSVTNGSLFNNRTLAAADRYKIFRLIYNRVATGTNEWILLGG